MVWYFYHWLSHRNIPYFTAKYTISIYVYLFAFYCNMYQEMICKYTVFCSQKKKSFGIFSRSLNSQTLEKSAQFFANFVLPCDHTVGRPWFLVKNLHIHPLLFFYFIFVCVCARVCVSWFLAQHTMIQLAMDLLRHNCRTCVLSLFYSLRNAFSSRARARINRNKMEHFVCSK